MEILIYLFFCFVCCFLVFAAGCYAWWLILRLGKREIKREDEYNKCYAAIQGYIRDWPVMLINHDALLIYLNELKKLKHKNPEKTKVLRDSFYWKYRGIVKQRTPCKSSAEAAFKI